MLSDDNHVLTANKAFVSLSLFNILNYPLSILPDVIMIAVQAGVSLERLGEFLRSNELDPNSVVKDKSIGNTLPSSPIWGITRVLPSKTRC